MIQVKAKYLQFLDESETEIESEHEISRPPRYGGRPNHGRQRGKKQSRVYDSDDDLDFDDSEAITDADIFDGYEMEIIQPEPPRQRSGSNKKVFHAQCTKYHP